MKTSFNSVKKLISFLVTRGPCRSKAFTFLRSLKNIHTPPLIPKAAANDFFFILKLN